MRSLTESKRLLDEARREINENRERAQIRTKHTFSRLPGFFPRRAEMRAIERALEGDPSFTVLFGASSVGKVRLTRDVTTESFSSSLRRPYCVKFSHETHSMFCTSISEWQDLLICLAYI